MKKFLNKMISCAITVAMLLMHTSKFPIAAAESTSPVIPQTIFALPNDLDTTWKKDGTGTLEDPGGTNQHIYWGVYPQSEITDITGLTKDVDYVLSNNKYFKIEPIKWRILSKSDGNLFLMSNKLLDTKVYNSVGEEGINWSNCELRTWLNGSDSGSFLNTAFTASQQEKIANTTVSAPYATTPEGGSFSWQTPFAYVTDKLFLLSGDSASNNLNDNELRNTAYGFAADADYSYTRQFELTSFAQSKNDAWGAMWTRSSWHGTTPGQIVPAGAFYIASGGGFRSANVLGDGVAVAPALKMSLTPVLFSSATDGAASSSGEFTEISGNPAMYLRFSGGQGTVTTTGNTVNYADAPKDSTLVVVATDAEGKSYQYHETLTNENGSLDLSLKGIAGGSTYEAWLETENNGILNASSPISGNIESTEEPNNPGTERIITYKNYDGSDIENLPSNYPKTYTEGQTLVLPTESPDSTMSGWEFLGFWNEPLDQTQKVNIPGPGYEDEQTLNLTVGNQIKEISAKTTGNITLYARYTSNVFDKDVNGRENYIFGAPGVFPNGSTANMKVLEPGTEEYQNTLQQVDDKDTSNIKIVEFQVLNSQEELVQPKAFFGDAVIGFKIPEGFNVNDTSMIRIVANGEDITLRSKIWIDPNNPDLKYIEGTTNHFSPYAILSPWNENIFPTGDNTWTNLTGIYAVLLASAGVLILTSRKKKFAKI